MKRDSRGQQNVKRFGYWKWNLAAEVCIRLWCNGRRVGGVFQRRLSFAVADLESSEHSDVPTSALLCFRCCWALGRVFLDWLNCGVRGWLPKSSFTPAPPSTCTWSFLTAIWSTEILSSQPSNRGWLLLNVFLQTSLITFLSTKCKKEKKTLVYFLVTVQETLKLMVPKAITPLSSCMDLNFCILSSSDV